MTVNSIPMSISYTLNGTDRSFDFLFGIGLPEDIKVTVTDPDGNMTTLTYLTEYSVVGTPIQWDINGIPIAWDFSGGGTVSTVATYEADSILIISTQIPLTQEVHFTPGMATLYSVFEAALDKLTRILKQEDARILALELTVATGEIVTTNMITYLGVLSADPNTAAWGNAERFTVWFNSTDGVAHYWSGSEIRDF